MPPETDALRRAVEEWETIPECRWAAKFGPTYECRFPDRSICEQCRARLAAFPTLLAMVAQVARLDPTAHLGVDTRTLWTNAAIEAIQKMMAACLPPKEEP